MLQLDVIQGFFMEGERWILSTYVFSWGNVCMYFFFLIAFILYISFNLLANWRWEFLKKWVVHMKLTLSVRMENKGKPWPHYSVTQKRPLGMGSLGWEWRCLLQNSLFLPLRTCLIFGAPFPCEIFIFCSLNSQSSSLSTSTYLQKDFASRQGQQFDLLGFKKLVFFSLS